MQRQIREPANTKEMEKCSFQLGFNVCDVNQKEKDFKI